METIIYSGSSEKNKKNYGLLAQRWNEFRNIYKSFADSNQGFAIPHFYVISMNEAREIKPGSLTWPISAWVSADQELNVPSNIFWNYQEFANFIKDLDKTHQEYSLIITKPKLLRPQFGSVKGIDVSLYVGNDVIIAVDKFHDNGLQEQIYPIPVVPNLFEKFGLDTNCLYKFSFTSNLWVLDGIYSRNSLQINNVIGGSITDISDQHLYYFCSGFKNGYLVPAGGTSDEFSRVSHYFSHIQKSNNFVVSQIPEIAINQGNLLGKMIVSKIRSGISNLTDYQDDSDLAEADIISFKNFNVQARLANAIFSNDLTQVRKALVEYSNSGAWNPGEESSSLYFAARFFVQLKNHQIEYGNFFAGPTPSAKFSEINLFSENFKINKCLSFGAGQVRIVDSSSARVSLRFQISNLRKDVEVIFDDGKVIKNPTIHLNSLETDFSFDFSPDAIKAFKNLNYSLPSTAGTTQKYAPIGFNQNGDLVTKESDLIICTGEKFASLFSSKI